MKFFSNALLLTIGLCSFKSPSLVKPLRVIQIDQYVTDTNGHQHHIHGWIDVNFFPPSITHWNIYYDNTHFQGIRADNPDPESAQVIQSDNSSDNLDAVINLSPSDYQLINDALNETLNDATSDTLPDG